MLERLVPASSRGRRAPASPGRRPRSTAGWPSSCTSRPCRTPRTRRRCPSPTPSCGSARAASRTASAARRAGTGSPGSAASGLPNGLRSLAYSTDSSMQNCAAPRLDAAWRMRFSLKKCCTTCRPRPSPPKIATVRHAHVGEPDVGVVGRHVERPQELDDLEARARRRHEERGDAVARRRPCRWCGRRSGRTGALWMPVFHVFSPLMTHSSPSRYGGGLHVRRVGAVIRLGDAEREARCVPSARSSIHSAFCSSVP